MKFKENLVEIMKLEKVAVHCNTVEKAKALLDELDKYDVCWCDYERIGSYTYWDRFKENTCYIIHNDRLNYGAKDVYTSLDRRIIELEAFLEEPMNNKVSMPNINDISDRLKSVAETECRDAIKRAEAYKEGYIAACEAFRREVRDILSELNKN